METSQGQHDLFKKRLKEKRDTLTNFDDKALGAKGEVFLRYIPNDQQCRFYERYIQIPHSTAKDLDVLQNGRYIYFFQTERTGHHQDGETIFRLIEIDLEKKNRCR